MPKALPTHEKQRRAAVRAKKKNLLSLTQDEALCLLLLQQRGRITFKELAAHYPDTSEHKGHWRAALAADRLVKQHLAVTNNTQLELTKQGRDFI